MIVLKTIEIIMIMVVHNNNNNYNRHYYMIKNHHMTEPCEHNGIRLWNRC